MGRLSATVEDGSSAGAAPASAEDGLHDLRDRSLGRMTGQLAHELRNALTGVRCYLELLGEIEMGAAMRSHLAEVQAGIDRMTDLATGWLQVTRGLAATAYLNAEIHRLLALFARMGVGTRIALRHELDGEVAAVTVAPPVLESALLVLLADLVERAPRAIIARTRLDGSRAWLELEATAPTAVPSAGIDLAVLVAGLGATVASLEAPRTGYAVALHVGASALDD